MKDDPLRRFDALPRRLFLDTSTLQALHDHGEFVWEGVTPSVDSRIWGIPGYWKELQALRLIFQVNERAMFEFAISPGSLQEVAAAQEASFLQWAYDVLDHWEACLSEHPAEVRSRRRQGVFRPEFGYLSDGDQALIADALSVECDAFLTMDLKLTKNRAHIERELGLLLLSPSRHEEVLRRWARLYL